MKDTEARRDIRRIESKKDKVVDGFSKEIKRVESKGDKARLILSGQIASLRVPGLCNRQRSSEVWRIG